MWSQHSAPLLLYTLASATRPLDRFFVRPHRRRDEARAILREEIAAMRGEGGGHIKGRGPCERTALQPEAYTHTPPPTKWSTDLAHLFLFRFCFFSPLVILFPTQERSDCCCCVRECSYGARLSFSRCCSRWLAVSLDVNLFIPFFFSRIYILFC